MGWPSLKKSTSVIYSPHNHPEKSTSQNILEKMDSLINGGWSYRYHLFSSYWGIEHGTLYSLSHLILTAGSLSKESESKKKESESKLKWKSLSNVRLFATP